MNNKSEGIRRIVLIFSILSVIAWVIFFAIGSDGFSPRRMDGAMRWLYFAVGIPASFFIPQLVSKVIYWIKDGFRQDKKR